MATTSPPESPSRPRPVGSATAAATGVLGVGSALASGDLVAALVSPPSSPFLAVGNQFIRLTPEPLKQFAIATFGVYDKVALLVGMAVVLLLVAVAAGLGSRRRPGPGLTVITLMGLAGIASTLVAPAFGVLDLVAPVVALVVGLLVFSRLHRLAVRAVAAEAGRGSDGDDGDDGDDGAAGGVRRRGLLLGVGGATLGTVVAGVLGRALAASGGAEASRSAVGPLPSPGGAPAPPPPEADFRAAGTPTWLTPNPEFYRIDTALQVPQISTADYELRIGGMVGRELRLSYDDLKARRLIEVPITMACVSNDIGGNLISNAVFLGVPLADLLREAGVRPGAEQIASTSSDGFTTGTPVDTVLDGRNAMLAIGMNGEPLPIEHGFPVRMVVPGLYGFVSGCKWLTDMELTTFSAFTPYWEQRGWAQRAPVKTQSRIDAPRDGATVPAGRVVVAGTAWAQHTGVDRVEVRADRGPWQTTDLAAEVNVDTWRMWRATLDLPPGSHRLEVRATDRSGYTQTPQFSLTIPDGATGWHTIDVTAT